MKNETTTKIDPKEYGLEVKKANELTAGLSTIIEERKALSESYNDIINLEITTENISIFRELRLKLRDNRTKGFLNWHKLNKEYFLTGGRFVDAIKNKEVSVNENMESKLMNAEKHFENIESEKIEKIAEERKLDLTKYGVAFVPEGLGLMPDEVWNAFIHGAKLQHKDKVEAEKKDEQESIAKEKADAEERIRIAKENEQLKKEAEAKAKQDEKERLEREKIEAERIAKEDEAERLRKKESDRIQAENEAKIEAERKEKEKLEEVIALKTAQELAEKVAEETRVQDELNKGDSAKVKDLIADLVSLKTKYEFKSAKNKKTYSDVGLLIDKVVNHIK